MYTLKEGSVVKGFSLRVKERSLFLSRWNEVPPDKSKLHGEYCNVRNAISEILNSQGPAKLNTTNKLIASLLNDGFRLESNPEGLCLVKNNGSNLLELIVFIDKVSSNP
ncbi:MAG: hypothetical protein ACPL0A_00820 [Candidatus Micrarchaeia archaeon]